LRRSTFFALALTLAGCTQVLGIEDPSLASDGGIDNIDGSIPRIDGGAVTGDCERYCDLALSICTKDADQQLFNDRNYCLAVCSKYPLAAAGAVVANTNTFDCRLALMEEANGSLERLSYCQAAGPGGADGPNGSGTSCGTNCEGYCSLRQTVCPDQPVQECTNRCNALLDLGVFRAEADFGSGADTLQCRLAHLATAANHQRLSVLATDDMTRTTQDNNRQTHCRHSGIKSLNLSMGNTVPGPCDDGKDMGTFETTCDGYCKLVTRACTGANAVYENEDQCLKVCAPLPKGTQKTATENNIRCRKESAYNALLVDFLNPTRTCANASAASAGCGGVQSKCQSYCTLAKAACGDTQFNASFATMDACIAACDGLQDSKDQTFRYNAPSSTAGRTVDCRVRHAQLALGGNREPTTCAAVFGAAPCQ